MHSFRYQVVLVLLLWATLCAGALAEAPRHEDTATTTSDPAIPLDDLKLKLEPLTSDKLFMEADGWLAQVKRAVEELNQVAPDVRQQNRQVERAESRAAGPVSGVWMRERQMQMLQIPDPGAIGTPCQHQ